MRGADIALLLWWHTLLAQRPESRDMARRAFATGCVPWGCPILARRFQDWSARTPIVSRSLLIAIVGGALLAFLAGIADVFSNVPVLVLGSFQVWRLFTYPLFESSFFTLLFTLLSFSTQGPKLELRMGSAAMAASVA